MADLAAARGVPLLFVDPLRNIKASFYLRFHVDPDDIVPGELVAWHQLYEQGLADKRAGRWAEAAVKLRGVRKHYVKDEDEILAFYIGECLEKLGRYDDARAEYEKPYLRHPMRGLIAEAAQARHVPVVDPYPYLLKLAEHGLPGYDEFSDSFHPMPAVSRIIARSIVDGLRAHDLVPGLAPADAPALATAEQLVQRLVQRCQLPVPSRMYSAIANGDYKEAIRLGRTVPADQLYTDSHVFEAIYLGWALTRDGDLAGAREVYDGLRASPWSRSLGSLPPLETDADIVINAYGGDVFSWF
jgi:tetratricopeptide (TPR) repeat protein